MIINYTINAEDNEMQKTKDYRAVSLKLDKSIDERLVKFCTETRMTRTATIEKALEKYLEEFKKTGKI